MQSYEKSSEMHNKNSILFSFPCAEDSKLVSLGLSKSFGKARVTVILENSLASWNMPLVTCLSIGLTRR